MHASVSMNMSTLKTKQNVNVGFFSGRVETEIAKCVLRVIVVVDGNLGSELATTFLLQIVDKWIHVRHGVNLAKCVVVSCNCNTRVPLHRY